MNESLFLPLRLKRSGDIFLYFFWSVKDSHRCLEEFLCTLCYWHHRVGHFAISAQKFTPDPQLRISPSSTRFRVRTDPKHHRRTARITIARTLNPIPTIGLPIPCPGKLGANLLTPCQSIDVCGTNLRDHDYGKEFENRQRSISCTCSRIKLCNRHTASYNLSMSSLPLKLDPARARHST